MSIVRDIKVAQKKGNTEETQKEGVTDTPFGGHVEKPIIIRQKRYM
jgi:hypothetical protein